MASAPLLYDIMEGIVIDGIIGDYRLNERKAAMEHLKILDEIKPSGKHIVLFDRGYPSYELFESLIKSEIYFAMRLPSSFKKLIFYDNADVITQYMPQAQKIPLTLRCIHVPLVDGTIEYLFTNIMESSFSTKTFKELSFMCWGIEGRYREVKVSFKLEDFSEI